MTEPLQGRRVLFIDDRLDVANMYIKAARLAGADTVYRSRLVAGLESLVAEAFDAVVIDLHMPAPPAPWPSVFAASIEALLNHPADMVRKHNLGQIVGHFISNSRNGVPPYMYVSAVAEYFERVSDCPTLTNPPCYDRYDLTSSEFLDEIVKLLDGRAPHVS